MAADHRLGLIPTEAVEQHRLLYTINGESRVNILGDEVARFIAGIRIFDQLADDTASNKLLGLRSYEDTGARIRSMVTRDGHFMVSANVIEPLAGHPLYDPVADEQFFFEGHKFTRSRRTDISPDHLLLPSRNTVRPYLELGTVALARAA